MKRELAAGKPPRYRIRALKRRIEASVAQCRIYARLTEVYAESVIRDQKEIQRLEAEIANGK